MSEQDWRRCTICGKYISYDAMHSDAPDGATVSYERSWSMVHGPDDFAGYTHNACMNLNKRMAAKQVTADD